MARAAARAVTTSTRRDATFASVNPAVHDGLRMDALRLALLLITLAAHPAPAAHPAQAPRAGLDAYSGTGAWIDRYDYALGAIVPDQRSTSYGHVLWPGFPYRALAATYDVFLPMAYSSFGRAASASGVYDYTARNIAYVHDVTHRPVHVIGGLAGDISADAEAAVVHAARDVGAYGVSLYKYARYDPASWTALADFGP